MGSHSMIHFIDYEASGLCLDDSYPIEVGVASLLPNGAISSWGTLIRPEPEWTHWNDESENVHKIPRAALAEGKSAREVALELNAMFRGKLLLCDGGRWDEFWTMRLFKQAGIEPAFELVDFMMALLWINGLTDPMAETMFKKVRAGKASVVHRAEADAVQHARYYAEALAMVRDAA